VAIVSVTPGRPSRVNLRVSAAPRPRCASAEQNRVGSRPPRPRCCSIRCVVGDLARAEQTVRNLNTDLVWSQVRLYESDGRRVIFDASSQKVRRSHAPRWLKQLVPVTLAEHRVVIVAPHGNLRGAGGDPLGGEPRERAVDRGPHHDRGDRGAPGHHSSASTHVILVVGLRPVRALAVSADASRARAI